MKVIKQPISCQIVEHGESQKLYYLDDGGYLDSEVVAGPTEYLLKIRLQGGETIKAKISEDAYKKIIKLLEVQT